MIEKVIVTGGSGFIGTNLVEHLAASSRSVYNLDVNAPKAVQRNVEWVACDILDLLSVKKAFRRIEPTAVIHLAARTDMNGENLDAYRVNTTGTENVVRAIRDCPSIARAIFTSSQFVVGPGKLPEHDEDFRPYTIYGRSKAISEQTIRQTPIGCIWIIVRPTNIWGPWHPRYPVEFWRVLKVGRYFHPGSESVIRSYGYVGNVVVQFSQLLDAEISRVQGKVFYLGDRPANLIEWVNAFSRALVGQDARVVNRTLVRGVAVIGDVITWAGGNFPMTTSRYRSMTTDYPTPMEATFNLLGDPPITLAQGVEETVRWLRSRDEFWK
jgi:nucleoside-diphosphate-sugar epimerase